MELIPLNLQPHKGIGLELDAEQLAALEKIRAGWSEDVRASRIVGYSTREMIDTFKSRQSLLEKQRASTLARYHRNKHKESQ